MNERYELTIERIQSILNEETVDIVFQDYFKKVAAFILEIDGIRNRKASNAIPTLEDLQKENQMIYSDILGENYEESYANPAYAVAELGEEIGKLLCFLYTEIRSEIPYVYEGRVENLTICNELFIEIYNCFEEKPLPDYRELRNIIYWYASDYCDVYVTNRIGEQVDPSKSFAKELIQKSDLNDLRYLYQYGEYISEQEVNAAERLSKLSKEEIEEMVEGLDDFDKTIVDIRYQVGNERIVKCIMDKLATTGRDCVIYRAAVNAVTKNGLEKMGFYGACANAQYEIDHQMDQGLFLNKKYIERKKDVMKNAYEQHKELAKQYAGAIVIEPFQDDQMRDACKLEAISLSERQKQLTELFEDKSGELVSGYKYL